MKVLTLWLGAFWFAINKLLWENNPNLVFYWFELNKEVCDNIIKTREHPYFFKWYKLTNNINVIYNYDDIIWGIDLLIIAIPSQFISDAIKWLQYKLKPGVTILNLSKWIDIKNNLTISQIIKNEFWDFSYNYAVLSWWMIAEEVIAWKKIWADLACTNNEICIKIKSLFENNYFKIICREEILNIELYWSLKNIMAIIVWYYEGKRQTASTIWFYMNEFFNELKDIINIYGWNKNIDFSYYSLGWDLIATCFWNSRNRYFWRLLWEWHSINQVLEVMKKENKHAEGYETLKAVYKKIYDKNWFDLIKEFYELIK